MESNKTKEVSDWGEEVTKSTPQEVSDWGEEVVTEPVKKKEFTGESLQPVQEPSESIGLSSLSEAKINVPVGERRVQAQSIVRPSVNAGSIQMYEQTQSNLSDIDKKISKYNEPLGISFGKDYVEELNKKRNIIQKSSDFALKAVKDDLDKISNNINYKEFLKKDISGFDVPDEAKISEYASKVSSEAGVSDSGYFKKLLYNDIKSKIAYKNIEPDVNQKFDELYKQKFGESKESKEQKMFISGMKGVDDIKLQVESQINNLNSELKSAINGEISPFVEQYKKNAALLNTDIKVKNSQIEQEAKNIRIAYENKQISFEDAKRILSELEGKAERQYKDYQDAFKIANDGLLDFQNKVNTKFNAQYNRQAREIQNIANEKIKQKIEDYQSKYQLDPKYLAEVKKIYGQANNDVLKSHEGLRKYFGDKGYGGMAGQWISSYLSTIGRTLSGYSSELGWDTGEVLGDRMSSYFYKGEGNIESLKDLLDPSTLTLSTAQLAGGMTASMGAGITVAAITKSPSVGIRTAVSGVASWFAESVDMAGNAKRDVFAQTGDAEKANKAERDTWSTQVLLAPTYALEMLPFIEGGLKMIRNKFLKTLTGAGIEYVSEFMQEYPQNIFEANIREGRDPFDIKGLKQSKGQDILTEQFKQTALNLIPLMGIGAFSQLKEKHKYTDKEIAELWANSQRTKGIVGKSTPYAQNQMIANAVIDKGENFAKTITETLFANGTITEEVKNNYLTQIEKTKGVVESVKQLGLTTDDAKAYGALMDISDGYLKQADATPDANAKAILIDKSAKAKENAIQILNRQEADYAVIEYQNGEKSVLSHEELSNLMDNPAIVDLYQNKKIKLSIYGDAKFFNDKIEELNKNIQNKRSLWLIDAINDMDDNEQIQFLEKAINDELNEDGDKIVFSDEQKRYFQDKINSLRSQQEFKELQTNVNIQQPMGEGEDNLGAVGDVSKVKLTKTEKAVAEANGQKAEDVLPTRAIFKKKINQEVSDWFGNTDEEYLEEGANDIRTETVNINDITPTQLIVDKNAIESRKDKGLLPVLVKTEDGLFVLDGHHRISSEILSGNSNVEAKIIDLTNEDAEVVTPKEIAKEEVAALPTDQSGRKVGSKEYKSGLTHKIGRTITKTAPDGTKIKGTFKIVSADELLPSHNPITFSKNEMFPQNKDGKTINDRDYETDNAAQSQVIDIAQKIDGTAVTQMPIVSKEGIVYDGNNRTMSRQLSASNKTDADYLLALKEQAEMYGFTEEQIDEVKNPTIVFEVEENLPFDTKTMAKFNKAEKKAQSPVQRAVAISKIISDKAKRQLALLYEQVETPSDVTSDPKMMKDAIDILVAEGLIQSVEIPRFVDKGVATPDGVSLLESIVMGASLNEDAIRELSVQGMGDIKKVIIKNIVGLMQNSTKGENSLISDIVGAINIFQKAKAGKLPIKDYLSQYNAFDANNYTLGEMCMALLLDTKKPTELKKFLENYNQDVGVENLFAEDTSKQGILDRTLSTIVSDYEKIKKNLEGIAEERAKPSEGSTGKPKQTAEQAPAKEEPKLTPKTKEEAPALSDVESTATDFGKVISASSRFRPAEMVVFEKPIVGKNGNKLISYQWAYEWTMQPSGKDTELKSKRVSDWTQAESSAETGRDIVHKFTVERTDGTIVTVSSETIPSLLGYVDAKEMKNLPSVVSSVKTLAKQRMQLAILKAQESEYNAIKKEVNGLPKPKIVPAEIVDLPKITQSIVSRDSTFLNKVKYWKTEGETKVIYRQEDNSNVPDNTTKEQLLGLWESAEIEKRGGKKPQGLYDLERRIERQEKKVEQATGSKLKSQSLLSKEQTPVSEPTLTQKLISDAMGIFYELKDGKKSSTERRILKEKMNEMLSKSPKIKYIFDNIQDINKELGDNIKKRGDC